MTAVDQLQLQFSSESLQILNWVLALIMFGVALDLRVSDFRRVFLAPLAPIVGLLCQFVLLPAFACLVVLIMKPEPSIGLGIMLVAACPGGTVSNFMTSLAKGNAALSMSMSAISTLTSIVMTPFNFTFWGTVNPVTGDLLQSISLDPYQIFLMVVTILVIPTLLGMLVNHRFPLMASKLLKPMRMLSILILFAFVVIAFSGNADHFVAYIGVAFWIVLIVNLTGLCMGYGLARLIRLPESASRAVCFETGIQNSGFGLILVFNFFGGLGGMALIAAWWGIWHLITGLGMALFWSRRELPK